MPTRDRDEVAIMWDCQHGDPLPGGGYTGSVCKKKDLCLEEGRCYFVAGVERYLERHNGQMPQELPPPKKRGWRGRIPEPLFQDGFDHEPIICIQWHPGYDEDPVWQQVQLWAS